MNLLEKLRMFNRELVKENARLSKIYSNMCESAAESGTDLNELDEGIGKALAGAALGAGIGAAAGGAVKGATADTELVKTANDHATAIDTAKADVANVAKDVGDIGTDGIAVNTNADGNVTIGGDKEFGQSEFARNIAANSPTGGEYNITKDEFNSMGDKFIKGKEDAYTAMDKSVKFAHDHAVAGGAAAGAVAGGAYGAMDGDGNDKKDDSDEDVDESEDGMQDFNSFVQGAQPQNEGEYSKYNDDRDPETGYVGPLKMSGEELFSEDDDGDTTSQEDEPKNTPEPEMTDEEFFSPTMDEADVDAQINDFFGESTVDEDDLLTSSPTNGNGTHNGHKVEEGQSIPAGKFLGLVNETDGNGEKEAAEFFKENDDDEFLGEDEDSNIPQNEFLMPEREHEIDELEKGEMMDYDEFYNTDANSDTVDDEENAKRADESLKSFKRRR